MFRQYRTLLGSIILLGALVCSCTKVKSDRTNTLHVQLVNEPISLDPLLAEDGVSLQVLNNLHQGLLGYDGEGKLQNRLAEKYSVSPDGKKFEFFLRKNIEWSDGRPIEVQDFLTAFERVLSPASRSKLTSFFLPIRGARAFQEKRTGFQEVGVYEKHGHLVIELEKAVPSFIHALTLPPALPIRKDILSANQNSWPETGPVTGPYRLIRHQMDQKIVLEENSLFWGEKPKIRKVEFKVILDETTGLNLFDHGDLDILVRVPSQDIARIKKGGQLHTSPFFATYYLSFDCRTPPFNNRNWRKAFAGVIRRDEIATLLEGSGQAAWSWIPNGIEGFIPYFDPKTVFSESIHWARSNARSLTPITAAFDTGTRNSQIMEKVQRDVKDALGIQMTLNHLDWKSYVKSVQTNPPALFRLAWLAPTLDPLAHLKAFTTGNLNNFSGWSNSRYDALIDQIEGMKSGEERLEKIKAAQKILLDEEAALVPIYHYIQNSAVSDRVRHFRINPFGVILFQELELEQNS